MHSRQSVTVSSKEMMMLKTALIATGALVLSAFIAAATGPVAMAATTKCLNKANKYVACTDRFRSKQLQRSRFVPQGQVKFHVDSQPGTAAQGTRISARQKKQRLLLPAVQKAPRW
jgi:hypothetical protein